MNTMQPTLPAALLSLLDFYLEQRRTPPPIYTHGAGVAPAPGFFSVASLQYHLNNPLLTPDWVQLRLQGQTVALESSCLWKLVQTKKLLFMDKEVLNDQLKRGAALVLEGLDILDPTLNAFVAKLDEALPCALANCVAFFSRHENEAYGGHCDSDDVLVVQLEGEKRWEIYTPQQRRYFNNSPLSTEQMQPLVTQVLMRPGDGLYVRAGVPHRCQTMSDYSLHLSFDLCDRTPNIEQMTHEANSRYNHACELPYLPASKVMDKYVALINSPEFQRDMIAATQQTKTNATVFRQRIGRSAAVQALTAFIKKPPA
ncbi:MAG: hypothetical protein HY080_16635 [Gammaproteobacteria bacterium]|nr:hypothetical protein [Gammaproteobacteria bacterium]